ncbi:MGMT family protein [Spelaeicoccus albus]|uniref:Alkylated DNA nucleotide flippase Atl1 n=1 Tax=Spelaeicoccus albus TaxID=1280376 RepID=A0A7Z0D3D8_9MICO|nr:MGMT family protein [Spelaeicoccus albus]NYI68101.1 alkylated DNA nucleotide flippase Atl1 [Spelaeicoccus albus]
MADPATFDDYAEQVYDVVEEIPPGRVLTYGDIAELIGSGGPRQVAAVMSRGVGGPWWRVVRADGSLPERLAGRARSHYLAERMPLMPGTYRVRMSAARWTPARCPQPSSSVPDDQIKP